jgi:hypothetical protein
MEKIRGAEMEARDQIVTDTWYQAMMAHVRGFRGDLIVRLICWLLWLRAPRDKKNPTRLVVSSAALAETLGQSKQLFQRNFCARDRLAHFENVTGISLDMGEWQYTEGKCRTVQPQWSDALLATLEQTVPNHSAGGKPKQRYLLNGGLVTPARKRQHFRAKRAAVADIPHFMPMVPEARRIMDYLNGLKSHRFKGVVDRAAAMKRDVETQLASEQNDQQANKLRRRLMTLDAIEADPVPVYAPSIKGKTVRLFAQGLNLTLLESDDRKRLTCEWVECDLAMSQLAIIAKLWDVPEVDAFLRDGGKIWDYLMENIRIGERNLLEFERHVYPHKTAEQCRKSVKKRLKKQLYALFYGRTDDQIIRKMNREPHWRAHGIGEQFLALPLIAALVEGQARAVERIRQQGGVTDVFGRILPFVEASPQKTAATADASKPTRLSKSLRSLLCQEAQAMELYIIFAAFKLAEQNRETGGFTITLFQHDGFCFVAHQRERTQDWIRRLEQCIKERGEEKGVYARLETPPSLRMETHGISNGSQDSAPVLLSKAA